MSATLSRDARYAGAVVGDCSGKVRLRGLKRPASVHVGRGAVAGVTVLERLWIEGLGCRRGLPLRAVTDRMQQQACGCYLYMVGPDTQMSLTSIR